MLFTCILESNIFFSFKFVLDLTLKDKRVNENIILKLHFL